MVEARMYTTGEVAEILKVTPYTVRKWIRDGKLKARKVSRKTYRVLSCDLEGFISNIPETSTGGEAGGALEADSDVYEEAWDDGELR